MATDASQGGIQAGSGRPVNLAEGSWPFLDFLRLGGDGVHEAHSACARRSTQETASRQAQRRAPPTLLADGGTSVFGESDRARVAVSDGRPAFHRGKFMPSGGARTGPVSGLHMAADKPNTQRLQYWGMNVSPSMGKKRAIATVANEPALSKR